MSEQIPSISRRKRLLLLLAGGLLLTLGCYVIARPEHLDGAFELSSSIGFRFVGSNPWTYMRLSLPGGGFKQFVRLGPIEFWVLDRGVEMPP